MNSIPVLLGLLVLAGVAGYFIAKWVKHQEETAPERALQGVDVLLSAYERLMINQREKSEAEARIAANAARYAAIQKRVAALPVTTTVPSGISVAVK